MNFKILLTLIHIVGFVIMDGLQVAAQICVGTAGEVTWSYWREMPDDELGELYADEYYPNRPDGDRIINSVKAPDNFDNLYGAVIRGFISVPTTESIEFNVTGDDDIRFYLSADDDPANLQEEALINGYTGREDHDKYPEQTSRMIPLTAGSYYYFEIHHIEGGGSDHATLWWKTSFTGLTDWNFVSSQYLANVGCLDDVCPDRGTPCDDGDATTTDDQEDGHCHCIGVATTTNACIGYRGDLQAYYYDSIPGGDLSDLYEDPDFPSIPDRYESLEMLGMEWRTDYDAFGTLVQAYLTVPISGQYRFNITSSDEAIFFMSSNDDPLLRQTHQILTTSSTGTVEHDKFIYQSTAPISLQAGRYYYIELNHKESSWVEHFGIFWQTPFSEPGQWKRIPDFYLHDYNCEISCIDDGTPCDDGDPFTNNDAFLNCDCVGDPCSGPDCDDPLASYIPYPECGLTDRMDTRADASWLSCAASTPPNPIHGSNHWLQYDLGVAHEIYASHIWNYNVDGGVNEGFRTVAIDYSVDGTTWSNLGTYNWDLATGQDDYGGFMGPDFAGVQARYILITSLEGAGGCRGISKMTFTTSVEMIPVVDNNCTQDTLMLGDSTLTLTDYSAIKFIATESTVPSSQDVTLMATEGIELMPGFSKIEGALLTIQIDDCTQTQALRSQEEVQHLKAQLLENALVVTPIADTEDQWIQFYVSKPGHVILQLLDPYGGFVVNLVDHHIKNAGYYSKRVRTRKLVKPNYQVILTTGVDHYSEVMSKR